MIQTTSKLPAGKAVIGTREIMKSIKAGKAKKIIVASNCPEFLIDKIKEAGKVTSARSSKQTEARSASNDSTSFSLERFEGDSKDLGTKLGKPFPVAMTAFQ